MERAALAEGRLIGITEVEVVVRFSASQLAFITPKIGSSGPDVEEGTREKTAPAPSMPVPQTMVLWTG